MDQEELCQEQLPRQLQKGHRTQDHRLSPENEGGF